MDLPVAVADQGFVSDAAIDTVDRARTQIDTEAAGGVIAAVDVGGRRGRAGDEGIGDSAVAVVEIVIGKATETELDVVGRIVVTDIQPERDGRTDTGDELLDVVLILHTLVQKGRAVLYTAFEIDVAIAERGDGLERSLFRLSSPVRAPPVAQLSAGSKRLPSRPGRSSLNTGPLLKRLSA